MSKTIYQCGDNTEYHREIHNGGNKRKNDLIEENIWKSKKAKPPIFWTKYCISMFPYSLKCSEHPPVSLTNKSTNGIGRFGKSNSVFFIENTISEFTDRYSKIRDFRKSITTKSSSLPDKICTPGTNSTRNNGNTMTTSRVLSVELSSQR